MESMEKEAIEIFRNKIKDKIEQLDRVIDYHMNNYNEEKISDYVDEKIIWKWCLELLSETEREVYNKERNDKNALLKIGNACYLWDSYDILYTIIDMNKTKNRFLVENQKTKDIILVSIGEITEIIEN